LHALILGWFENRDHYHKVGYLVAVGRQLSDLVALAKDRTKSDFEASGVSVTFGDIGRQSNGLSG